jgi:hypothetical protein
MDNIIIYIITKNLSILYDKNKNNYNVYKNSPCSIMIKNNNSNNIIIKLSIDKHIITSKIINYYDEITINNLIFEKSCFSFLPIKNTHKINITIELIIENEYFYDDSDKTPLLFNFPINITENIEFMITEK